MHELYIPDIILTVGVSAVACFWLLSAPKKKDKPRPDEHYTEYPSSDQTFKLNGTAIDDDELIRFAWQQWRDNRDEIKTVSTVYHARHLLLELGHRVEPNKPCGCGHKH
jgi:hypothetical protein